MKGASRSQKQFLSDRQQGNGSLGPVVSSNLILPITRMSFKVDFPSEPTGKSSAYLMP